MKGENNYWCFQKYFSWINIKSQFKLWSEFFWVFSTSRKLPTFHSTCQLPQSVFISSYHLCLSWKSAFQTELHATELLSSMFGKWKVLWSNFWLWFFFFFFCIIHWMHIKMTSEVRKYLCRNKFTAEGVLQTWCKPSVSSVMFCSVLHI